MTDCGFALGKIGSHDTQGCESVAVPVVGSGGERRWESRAAGTMAEAGHGDGHQG